MTSLTRLGCRNEDLEEQKRLSKLWYLQSPHEGQSKKSCETNHFSVLLNIGSLLREERTKGRALFLIFYSSKELFMFKPHCTAKNYVINYSGTLSCGYFLYFMVFYANN